MYAHFNKFMEFEVITYTKNMLATHPAEDAFNLSKKYPILAVADGVTIMERDKNGSYPDPSGAKMVADAFCQKSVEWVEKNYQSFSAETLRQAFNVANKKIKQINEKTDRTKQTINFFDFDFFHTTAALAVIKEGKLFYGRIHDCWITVIDRNGKVKLSLIEPWDWEAGKRAKALRPKNWDSLSEKEKTTYEHKYSRNGILKSGELAGYGVLTGEEAALRYLETDSVNLEEGDIVLIYTDGFEEYDKLKEFLDIFMRWEKNDKRKTESALKKFSKEKAEKDESKFGHERTLIAVRY
jgi:serine/threonine protein phosphatase PrpC